MKRAASYRHKEKYIIHPYSQTTDGVWIAWDPVVTLGVAQENSAFGAALIEALDRSLVGVPHPKDWSTVGRSLLAIRGVRSWRNLYRYATSIEIEERDNGAIALQPTRRMLGGGFEADESREVFSSREAAAKLGELAIALLKQELDPLK